MTCYEGKHMVLAGALGITGLVLIAAGWPIVSALLLVMKDKLACGDMQLSEDMLGYYIHDYKMRCVV